MKNINTKKIDRMTQHEIELLAHKDLDRLIGMLNAFLLTDKKLNRSIVFAMIHLGYLEFAGKQLDRLNLSNMNFQHANFEGAIINHCNFNSSDLCNATFENAQVHRCDFRNTLMIDTVMHSGRFKKCYFKDAALIYAGSLPNGLELKNDDVDEGLSDTAIFIDCEDEFSISMGVSCLIALLDYFSANGVDDDDCELLANKIYPFLIFKKEGIDSSDCYLHIFTFVHAKWLIRNHERFLKMLLNSTSLQAYIQE